ncbi:hypothetical protein VNO78_03323 [Psophocarpus tetragonolobus]|uniref:Mechanosensitive ion channel MscS domain-containing protein n=1 Tax=Psophocarpus tetragonolobus TaxID=3891 RepID=A0AAN9T1Z9_PSOTE
MEEERGVANQKVTKNEVVLRISDTEEEVMYAKKEQKNFTYFPVADSSSLSHKGFGDSEVELAQFENLTNKGQVSTEQVTTTESLMGRSEPTRPKDANFVEEDAQTTSSNSSASSSPNKNVASRAARDAPEATTVVNRKTPLIRTQGKEEEDDDDDDEEVYKIAHIEMSKKYSKKRKVLFFIELFAFVCIMCFLIASLTVHELQHMGIWGLELWKWGVFVLVILCGRLVTGWFINFLVFLIERNFLFKKKVLYFVYGVKKSVQTFIWLSLVLLTWGLLIKRGLKRSQEVTTILNYITKTLGSCVIGAGMWLIKAFVIKLLASKFQTSRFFNRIQESIFHQYILKTLSGPPLMEMAEKVGKTSRGGHLNLKTTINESEGEEEEVIDVDKLKKMKQEKVSARTMKGLIHVIKSSGLSTISSSADSDHKDNEITSEWKAKAAAYRIFANVAKPGNEYIEKDDLLRFMKKEEVENVFPLFEGALETGRINRKSLKNWLVKVYLGRQSLVHSLHDTNTAVGDLNVLVSVNVVILIIIVWLLLMGFLSTQLLVVIVTQITALAFMFGNTAKTVFESIVFLFAMHPFDIGDRCVIDGVQLVVEEMSILSTVFLKLDNEKIFYPNSVLATKPISNYYRSPEMGDSVKFAVDLSTSIESIGALKAKIKAYLESMPQHWRPNHTLVVEDIENGHKMEMVLYFTHTINFQKYNDKRRRRSELILELKKILEDLNIKYHLQPQEVRLSYVRDLKRANKQLAGQERNYRKDMASTSAVSMAMPLTYASQKRVVPRSDAFVKPLSLRSSKAVMASNTNGRFQVRASMKEKVVTGLTAAALTASMMVPDVAEAAVSPSLKNFLLSIAAGGVVVVVIVGAVIGVANFDPVKRS